MRRTPLDDGRELIDPTYKYRPVLVDGSSVSGNGETVGLHTVPGGTAVAVDGTTIVGDGTTGNPLVAIGGGGGGGTVHTDATLTGDGSVGTPLGLAELGVTPGQYDIIGGVVDANGRVTSAANPFVINVKTHGARGDGTTDDTAAIQTCINTAQSAGLKVFFPAGTYLINSTLQVSGQYFGFLGTSGATIRFSSSVRNGVELTGSVKWVEFRGLFFQGDPSDDFHDNIFSGIQWDTGPTDVLVERCHFDHCQPLACDDSAMSSRLLFINCVCTNLPSAMHPPSDSVIRDCQFLNDAVVSTRCQFIYCYGQFENVLIDGCTFKNGTSQDIQIRAATARWKSKQQFRIVNCHFVNSSGTSIWVGSDDTPDIGTMVIANNTFHNVNGAVDFYVSRGSFVDNVLTWDWECPIPGGGILVTSGDGLGNHRNTSKGVIVANNTFIVRDPYWGTVTFSAQPAPGDTLTLGYYTYTFVSGTPVNPGDVQIGPSVGETVANLQAEIVGDGIGSINNVLRDALDCRNNPFAADYGESDENVLLVTSWFDFSAISPVWAVTGTAMTLSEVTFLANDVGSAVILTASTSTLVEGNTFVDFFNPIKASCSRSPMFDGNIFHTALSFIETFICVGNSWSWYSPTNRLVNQFSTVNSDSGRDFNAHIEDAFPVIELPTTWPQQFTNPTFFGRSGTVSIGDGCATTYFWYGMENTTLVRGYTQPWRWDDLDVIELASGVTNYTLTYKRDGSGSFNSPDTFIAAVNALGPFAASYVPTENDLGSPASKLLIQIKFATAGTAGNAGRLIVQRTSSDGHFLRVPQPQITAQILHDLHTPESFARFYAGCATPATKTFVPTVLADPSRPIFVQGVDAQSQALAPIVYQADIVPGVGFTITSLADNTGGEAVFSYRVA